MSVRLAAGIPSGILVAFFILRKARWGKLLGSESVLGGMKKGTSYIAPSHTSQKSMAHQGGWAKQKFKTLKK
jgi:hypothetical protein